MNSKKGHTALSPELIEKYLTGKLSHAEMHEVEKLMLSSDFDAEAMEGFENADAVNIPDDLDQLRHRIDERTNTKRSFLWIKIAASIAILAISTFVILQLDFHNGPKEIAKSSEDIPALLNDSAKQSSTQENFSDSLLAMNKKPEQKEALQEKKQQSAVIKETPDDSAKPEQKQVYKSDQPPMETFTYSDGDIKQAKVAEEADAIQLENLLDEEEVIGLPEASEARAARQRKIKETSKKALQDRMLRSYAAAVAAPENTSIVTGTVTSAEDGSVLPGVNMTVKNTSISTITDLDGQYKLIIPDTVDAVVVASFIGMKNEEVATDGKATVDLKMEDDLVALNEVVVIGYGAEEKVTTDVFVKPSPADGWSNFKKFINEHLRYPSDTTRVKGKVVLEFDVTPDGELTNFEIIRSLGSFYDKEAIRIVKEGPPWKPATHNGNPKQDKVRMKIKFK